MMNKTKKRIETWVRNIIKEEVERALIENNTCIDERLNQIKLGLSYDITYNRERLSRRLRINDEFKELHKKTFAKYKNCNVGKDMVIIATGPSLEKFEPIENAIYIGINEAIFYKKVILDYYFVQDYHGVVREYMEDIINYYPDVCQKFFGIIDEPCYIPDEYAIRANAMRYYTNYDSALIRKDLLSHELADFGSTVFPAMSFALWTHPKKIYIVGCDCKQTGKADFGISNKFGHYEQQVDGWRRVKEFADIYYPDVEIISVNPVGLKGMFQDMYTCG